MDDAQNSFPSELLASAPSGSAAAPAPADPAPMVTEPMPVVSEPAAVADPFAPLDNFGMDDLD